MALVLDCESQAKGKWRTDKPFGKLGPSSSSSCSTLSPSSIIIAPRIITSPAQLKPPKVHYLLLPLANPPTLKGSSRVKTHLAFNQNPYHLMSGTPPAWHVSIGLVFPIAIFHLGQVTCRSGLQRGISITRNKRISVHFEYIFMTPWCEQQRKWTRWNFL